MASARGGSSVANMRARRSARLDAAHADRSATCACCSTSASTSRSPSRLASTIADACAAGDVPACSSTRFHADSAFAVVVCTECSVREAVAASAAAAPTASSHAIAERSCATSGSS